MTSMMSREEEERAEVHAVLRSGLFLRAPNLENFFRYACDRYFLGESEQIKEYSIAVEALGRPAEFDPKKDSIVRVEAYRLRKRLTEYYLNAGAGRLLRIEIPRGSYAPQFVRQASNTTESVSEQEAKVVETSPSETNPSSPIVLHPETVMQVIPQPGPAYWIAGLLVLLLAIGIPLGRHYLQGAKTDVWKGNIVNGIPDEVRILAGYDGDPVTDSQGRAWRADAFYSGGRRMSFTGDHVIQGLPSPDFIKGARTGIFRYDVPVRPGVYEVHLYFAETEYGYGNPKGGGDGSRLFHLSLTGKQPLLLDVHALAGAPNRLFVRVIKDVLPSADGKIHIVCNDGASFVNALEILPTSAGRIRPVRIVAQAHSVTDADGKVWSADEYVVGGTLVLRNQAEFHQHDSALYQGERYGNFSYHIPLASGKYRLTLHFAETWFGTPKSTVNRDEHRLFDIYANGVALVRGLDVLGEAGLPNHGITKVFEGLQPNAQGELTLQFVPLANYAEVNAIEVVETE